MTVLQRPEPPVASLDIRLHPLYYWGMNSVKHSANPPRKTKPKGRHPDKALSAAFVRTAPPGRHCDGNGFEVPPVAVPLPMLDLEPSVVPGVGAS